MRTVCVFCGASAGFSPLYAAQAAALGRAIASGGRRLVYGGGDIGLMGVLAQAALDAGGEVLGIIPKRLAEKVRQPRLTELIVTRDMHERKARMAALSDAFIALPGGIGTLEELFEAWTWRQLGYHAKPVGILDVDGFYAPLMGFLSQASERGFLKESLLAELIVREDPELLLADLEASLAAPLDTPLESASGTPMQK